MKNTDSKAGSRILVLATHNRDKGREIAERLMDLPLQLRGLWEWSDHVSIEETGATLEENARLKAEDAALYTGQWAISDDTGLLVDGLHGAPGVLSARYSGPEATYASNRQLLLDRLRGVPPAGRGARFETVIALARPNHETVAVRGVVEGEILLEERGTAGFGYDAIFYYPPLRKSFAELSLGEKNSVSHRGRALDELRNLLHDVLEPVPPSARTTNLGQNL